MADNLKVWFVDCHSSFSPEWNHIMGLLRPHFPVGLCPEPEFLFYGDFGHEHESSRYDGCTKIYLTEEPFQPDFSVCDFALTSNHLPEPWHLRLPIYVRYLHHLREWTGKTLVKPETLDVRRILLAKAKFCNFVYSNPAPQERIRFFKLLSKYKRVDSGGSVENNLGHAVPRNTSPDMNDDQKLKFIAPYKFTIAFENTSLAGYVSEKLVEPMAVDSLAIYWGDPSVAEDFNPRSFINASEYDSLEAVADKIVELDKNDDLYLNYLRQPHFHGNKPNRYCSPDYIIPFFARVFSDLSRRDRRLSLRPGSAP